MHSARAASDGDVDARIDEQTCWLLGGAAGVRFPHDRRRSRSQFNQFASAQVLFPKLNRIHSGRGSHSNAFEQQTNAFVMIGRELPAVSDVVEKQASNLPCSRGDATLCPVRASLFSICPRI